MKDKPSTLNNFKVEKNMYWINGVPRNESNTIYYQGEFYAPLKYLSQNLGLAYKEAEAHDHSIYMGDFMNDYILKLLQADYNRINS